MHADLAAVVGVHLARLLLRPAPVEAPAPGGRPQRVLVLRQQVRAVLAARAGRRRGLPLCAGSNPAVSLSLSRSLRTGASGVLRLNPPNYKRSRVTMPFLGSLSV